MEGRVLGRAGINRVALGKVLLEEKLASCTAEGERSACRITAAMQSRKDKSGWSRERLEEQKGGVTGDGKEVRN